MYKMDLDFVIKDQKRIFQKKEKGLHRHADFDKHLKTKKISIITGPRRAGKSTLLAQFAENYDDFLYVNFDDERLLDFKVQDFQNLMVTFHKGSNSKTLFLDEIQNIPSWERFIRRIHDEGYKVFITGSNASLLSSELSTHLTGRYLKTELYPFSFKEILTYHEIDSLAMSTKKKAKILSLFDKYLNQGGFPEIVKGESMEAVQRIYEDVIYKDLIARFKIREIKSFKQLGRYLMSNVSKEISFNSLKKTLGIKSVTSVKNYVNFLQEGYLIFELFKYDFSLKKQFVNSKKIYVIDNGMRNSVAFYFSKDKGRLLENLVFLELKQREKNVFFHKEQIECDFIIQDRDKITEAYQVCWKLTPTNRNREVKGLLEALSRYNLKKGTILTYNQKEQIKEANYEISVLPSWEWMIRK